MPYRKGRKEIAGYTPETPKQEGTWQANVNAPTWGLYPKTALQAKNKEQTVWLWKKVAQSLWLNMGITWTL